MLVKDNKRYQKALNMRLEGLTYADIASVMGVTRQRIQQILSPPKATKELLLERSGGKCEVCGLVIGKTGYVYRKEDDLMYLCISCRRRVRKQAQSTTLLSQLKKVFKRK